MTPSKPTEALASFAAGLDASALPYEVREKLGWLLLDFLRVCSIGARLPWSGWARRYVGAVGKAGASHVLYSSDMLNPQHATFMKRHLRRELRWRRHPCRSHAASRRWVWSA